jgi:hypothetical protein
MVYKESLIAVIKVDGKILREQGEYVTLPFGTEYSILIKNLETRKVQVKIHIDGKDVGGPFLIESNRTLSLDRFVERMDKGPRFKFIEKTEEISGYRGDKIDDGFIRVEYTYEKQPDVTITKKIIEEHHTYFPSYPYTPIPFRTYSPCTTVYTSNNEDITFSNFNTDGIFESGNRGDGKVNISNSISAGDKLSVSECCYTSQSEVIPGITVPGSESHQQFTYGHIGELEEVSHSIIIRLKGIDSNSKTKVKKPITTKTKLVCSSCGKKSKSNINFCPKCGTNLL